MSLPTAPMDRVSSIDALRGLALFGVLAINLETEFRISIFRQFLRTAPEPGWNGIVDRALDLFVDMKAFALFSFLFGVGLAIQFDRLASAPRRAVLLVRRLLVLLLFGLVHLILIWNGDILTEYALAGLIVLPFLFAPMPLIAIAAAILLAFYVLQPSLPTIITFPQALQLSALVDSAGRIYAGGTFWQVLTFRVQELPFLLPLHLFVFPRTIGLMLLGIVCWRTGLFGEGPGSHRSKLWLAGTATVAGALLLAQVRSASAALATPIIMASGYAALVIAAEQTRIGTRALRWAEPVGRMAFTNYIMQSVVLGFIFYGYGLGLFNRIGSLAGLLLVVGVYVTQIVISRLWLARFAYGPIEWLWRALMYGRAPVFRRSDAGLTTQSAALTSQ